MKSYSKTMSLFAFLANNKVSITGSTTLWEKPYNIIFHTIRDHPLDV